MLGVDRPVYATPLENLRAAQAAVDELDGLGAEELPHMTRRIQQLIDAAAQRHEADARAAELIANEECALITGDYNIIPQAEDAARPEAWQTDALARPETRAAYREILNLGFTEAFRARTLGPDHYSFWDYQAGAWNRNDGIRIDHHLLTPQAADLLENCWIESAVRAVAIALTL